ncbi:MAG: helix-turn-helix transcriptional regulator [Ktedonobacteraceae bacterium]|nr:helix-turn-helix transcriptional regulator [Ktedonobacteraceae bacterium]
MEVVPHHHHGRVIKEARQAAHMTQEQLAEVWPKAGGGVGVSWHYVQDVEYGKRRIESAYTLRELAKLLSIPLWKFGLSEYDPFDSPSLQNIPEQTEPLFSVSMLNHGQVPPARIAQSSQKQVVGSETDQKDLKEDQVQSLHTELIPMDQVRRDIAKLLGISPIFLVSDDLPAASEHPIRISVLDPEITAMYNEHLRLSWQLFYTYSVQVAKSTIEERIANISARIKFASGLALHELIVFKCCFLQLDGVCAKDQLNLQRSLERSSEAITLAIYLDNAELLSAALFRRARTHLYLRDYDLAVQDLEQALPYAQRSRNPLKSYIYICLAEAYSLRFAEDVQVQQKALALLDLVGEALRSSQTGILDGDGSYTKVDIAGWSMEKANVLSRFGNLVQAREVINDSRKELSSAWTRWQGNLEVADARLSFLENDVERCCDRLRLAATIARSTYSKSNAAKIQALYGKLYKRFPSHRTIRNVGEELDFAGPA